jgi:hypothetical protein
VAPQGQFLEGALHALLAATILRLVLLVNWHFAHGMYIAIDQRSLRAALSHSRNFIISGAGRHGWRD